ncbi:MAG: sucrase ferredoxin [Micropruina sp.]|uniref:sucrase ferredoxin n=1 Tax=Micropruina sp. TaxID=2737536 RepID=UPI0039E54CE5
MSVRCSVASEQRGEPLAGTASTVRHFLLLEDPGPWGPEILRSRRLPGPVREPLRHWQRDFGVRPLLIRRPGRYLAGPRRIFVVNARYGWCETTTVSDLAEVADLDLSGIRGGAGVGLTPHPDPVLLVCTHGRHDACCAERGRPLAAALGASWPELTWESSHLGGDRFAANLLVLPDAHCYGRLTPEDGPDVVADHLAGRVTLERYRGHCSVPWPEQAAEHVLRERLGLRDLDAVRVRRLRRDGTLFSVTLAAGGRTYRVDVRHGARAPELLTCQSTQPSGAVAYDLVAFTRLN